MNAGFTLMEMLIVLVILGLLIGVAVPGFGSYRQRAYLLNEARALIAEIQRGQVESVVRSRSLPLDTDFVRSHLQRAALPGERNLGPPLDGLAIEVEQSGQIARDGSCAAARMRLTYAQSQLRVAVEAPSCRAALSATP